MVEEDIQSLGLLTVVLDDDARAVEDFSWGTISVDLAEADPLADHLAVSDLDEVDLVLIAESLDELDVLLLGASFVQDAEMGLTFVKGLGALAQTTGETVVDHGLLENLFESLQNIVRSQDWRNETARLASSTDILPPFAGAADSVTSTAASGAVASSTSD